MSLSTGPASGRVAAARALLRSRTWSLSTILGVILITLVSILQSYILREHSLVGDGIAYTATYEGLAGVGLLDGYTVFQEGLGASEFFSYTLLYLSAQLFSYDVFIYLSNVAFALSIYAVYRSYGKHVGWFLATVPLNFYFLAMCFGAQRLKLGLIFLMLAAVASRSSRTKLFAVLALFSHFQLVIIFVAERIRGFFSGTTRLPVMEMSAVLAVCLSIYFTVPALQLKVLSYLLERGEINLATFSVSFLIAVLVSRFDFGIVAEFLFFLALILVIGESRVNILVFCVLWRLIFLARRRPVFIAYGISLYLSLKGVIFMIDVVNGGTGFGAP